MKQLGYLLIACVLTISLTQYAYAQSAFYIRDGAAGQSCASWVDACDVLPSSLVRGAVYYIADGAYPAYNFDDPASGSLTITIRKATVNDHGTQTGWQNSYGDGSALFPSISVSSSYWVIDGTSRTSDRSGHGIRLSNTSDQAALISLNGAVSEIVLRHLDVSGDATLVNRSTGMYGVAAPSNITVEKSYFHDFFGVPFHLIDARNVMIQQTVIARNRSTAAWHSEGVQCRGCSYFTSRYNIWEDIEGTAVIVSGSGNSHHWYVYGNVFNRASVGHGVVSDNQIGSISNVYFYNNTVIGQTGNGGLNFWNATGNIYSFNNVWYDATWAVFTNVTGNYNYYSRVTVPYAFKPGPNDTPMAEGSDGKQSTITTNPFVNLAAGDFRLASVLTNYPGIVLDAAYGLDAAGATRGADGLWDRGAFEYNSGGASSTYTLLISKAGSGSGTVSGEGISCGSDCSETSSAGKTIVLTAAPQTGSVFAGWSGGGCSGTGNCSYTAGANATVTATFNAAGPVSYLLSVAKSGSGSGTVSGEGISCGSDCSETVSGGRTVVLAATPQSGSVFAGWSGGGCSGTGNCIYTAGANATVTATFNAAGPVSYLLSVAKSGSGSGTVSGEGISCGSDCSEPLTAGRTIALTATPQPGSVFAGWSGGGCSGTGGCSYTASSTATILARFDQLATACLVSGAIRLATGEPISKATVEVAPNLRAVTDAQGSFSMADVPLGEQRFIVKLADGTVIGRARRNLTQSSCAEPLNIPVRYSLASPSYFEWNGFLNQTNVAAIFNRGAAREQVKVTLYGRTGSPLSETLLTIEAKAEQDLILNELQGFRRDDYGTIKLEFDSDAKIGGYVAYYRFNAGLTEEEFSIFKPFDNPLHGRTFLLFNTYQPSRNPTEARNALPQWVHLSNLSGQQKGFVVRLIDQKGDPLRESQIQLPAFGRVDIQGGHEYPGRNFVGLIEVQPMDNEAPYLAQLFTYSANTPDPTRATRWSFAHAASAAAGASFTQYVTISSGGDGENWLALANVGGKAGDVEVEFLDNYGRSTGGERRYHLGAYSQLHLHASAAVTAGASGVARVRPLNGTRVIGKSMTYFFSRTGTVTAAYGASLRAATSGRISGSYNSFLEQVGWLRVFNTGTTSLQGLVRLYSNNGQEIARRTISLPAERGFDYSLTTLFPDKAGPNLYGTIDITPLEAGAFLADQLRVRFRADGGPDMVQPVPLN